MNCQHCGAELTNKRAKNCSTCSGLLADANKARVYGAVTSAIEAAKAEGITGAEMHEVMTAAMSTGQGALTAKMDQIRANRKARQQEYCSRQEARIRYYQEHGCWPEVLDEEGADLVSQQFVACGDGRTDMEEVARS